MFASLMSSCYIYFLSFPKSLVSGGVDSTVCTALLNAALSPDQVIAVLIDNGFLRLNERTVRSTSG